MPRLALYQPDIPQNTGTLLRLAACLGVAVDIIEPAGFDVSDRNFRRAGLDYLDQVEIARHASWRAFEEWRQNGGLPIFGFPISGEMQEVSPIDGKTYTVQYFERNRFEYHPEFRGTRNEVLLGLLGVEIVKSKGWIQP